MEEEQQEEKTVINNCPNCGGVLKYSIKEGELKCPNCGYIQPIENNDAVMRRELTDDILKSKDTWTEAKVYRCDNCGAKQVLDKKDISQVCPFCGSPNIVCTEEMSGIKPDSLIPFQITNNASEELFKKWISSRKLAPHNLKSDDIREHLNRIYCPTWSFSANVFANYNGVLGKSETYTKRDINGNLTTETRINWFNVSGQMTKTYTDYIIQSSDRISPIIFNKLKPFDLKNIKNYQQEYLSGISAQQYTRNIDVCFNDFSNNVRSDIRRMIMQKYNADSVRFLNIQLTYPDKRFNYLLLPLYIANYEYKNKTYNFYINGISGKVIGKSPISKLKIFLITAGVVITAGIVVFLLKYFNVF